MRGVRGPGSARGLPLRGGLWPPAWLLPRPAVCPPRRLAPRAFPKSLEIPPQFLGGGNQNPRTRLGHPGGSYQGWLGDLSPPAPCVRQRPAASPLFQPLRARQAGFGGAKGIPLLPGVSPSREGALQSGVKALRPSEAPRASHRHRRPGLNAGSRPRNRQQNGKPHF